MENKVLLKACKICGIEKDATLDFTFHTPTGYFKRTCIECENKKRRESYVPKVRKISTKTKICKTCNISKIRNEDNFEIQSNGKQGKKYFKSCKECRAKMPLKSERKRRYVNEGESAIKKSGMSLEDYLQSTSLTEKKKVELV